MLFGATAACKRDQVQSNVKEFELSSDICGDLTKATEARHAAYGQTREEYFAALVANETKILDYEIPRYQRRLAEFGAPSAPADGPQGPSKPLAGVPGRETSEAPVAQQPSQMQRPPAAPQASPLAVPQGTPTTARPSTLNLASSSNAAGVNSGAALAREVCPGCTKDAVARQLAMLEANRSKIGSCPAPTASAATEAKDRETVIQALTTVVSNATDAAPLCQWWGEHAGGVGANRDRCKRESIESMCRVALSAGVGIGSTVATEERPSDGSILTNIVRPVPLALKDAIVGCLQQMSYDVVKNALRTARTREFVPQFTRDMARQAIDSDQLGPSGKQEKITELKKQIALALCKSAAEIVSSQIDEQPQINFDHPCAAIFHRSKSRLKACSETMGSGCRIAGGEIDLRNFLPEGSIDDKPLETLAVEAANTIASAGCEALKTGPICGAISEAGAQIRSAIVTGNNAWAHCVGTDQMGACGGTVFAEWALGVKSGDAGEPVRIAQPSVENPGYHETEVCWCFNSCYQDDMGSDTELSRHNYYTQIARGDAGVRECQNKEGRWDWTGDKSRSGHHLYWRLHECGIVKARSRTSEGFASAGGFEVQVNGRWYYKNMTSDSGSCPAGL